MNRPCRLLAALLAAMFLTACETRRADDYALDEIEAEMTLSFDEDSRVKARVRLRPEGEAGVYLMLDEKDAIELRVGGKLAPMEEESLLGMVAYEARIDRVRAESLAEVSLRREIDGQETVSAVYLPAPVAYLMASSDEVSRAEPLTLWWDLPARALDNLTLRVTGACIYDYQRALSPTDRTVTIEANELVEVAWENPAAAMPGCEITATIEGSRAGLLDPAFGGGNITAYSETSIALVSTR